MSRSVPKLEEMKDILDLKGINVWDLTWFWLGVLSFLLLAVAYLSFRIFKKYSKKPGVVELSKTPIECALGRLHELVNSGLFEGKKVRQFYFNLSEIFRDYLEDDLSISANEATFEELKPLLKGHDEFTQEELKDTYWLLELCDMAKFAQYIPSNEEMVKSVKACRLLMSSLARRHEVLVAGEINDNLNEVTQT